MRGWALWAAQLVQIAWANTCISSAVQDTVTDFVRQSQRAELLPTRHLAKWAIVSLTRPDSRSRSIHTRNDQLATHLRPFAAKHDITAVFFSELPFSQLTQLIYRKAFKGVAAVQFVDTSIRGYHQPPALSRFGYKYMCKFFSLDMYDYLQGFDFYMRCDSDCYVKRLPYDVLQWAEDHGVQYGYALRKLETHGPTKQGLPVWTQKYLRRCAVQPRAPMDRALSVAFNFYNNWHLGRVGFFNRPDVRHFLEAVNASGHILRDRWGDSTIQAYAVRLFMDPAHIARVPNFTYVHGIYVFNRVSTFAGDASDVPQQLPPWPPSGK